MHSVFFFRPVVPFLQRTWAHRIPSVPSLSLSLSPPPPCFMVSFVRLQVPSGLPERTVGYEDPSTHQLVWFNLAKGPLHYVPDIGLYFKLKPV